MHNVWYIVPVLYVNIAFKEMLHSSSICQALSCANGRLETHRFKQFIQNLCT